MGHKIDLAQQNWLWSVCNQNRQSDVSFRALPAVYGGIGAGKDRTYRVDVVGSLSQSGRGPTSSPSQVLGGVFGPREASAVGLTV